MRRGGVVGGDVTWIEDLGVGEAVVAAIWDGAAVGRLDEVVGDSVDANVGVAVVAGILNMPKNASFKP